MTVVEILPLFVKARAIYWLRPQDEPSWQVQSVASASPGEAAASAIGQLATSALVVHSTSWRFQSGNLVLTYIAVIANAEAAIGGFQAIRVRRQDIGRGTATAPPQAVTLGEVVEHALRHLAWLARDDPSITAALPEDWARALSRFPAQPLTMVDIAATARARGDFERAARLLGAAEALGEGGDLPQQESGRTETRAALGNETFNRLWAEGESMTFDEAVAYTLEHLHRPV